MGDGEVVVMGIFWKHASLCNEEMILGGGGGGFHRGQLQTSQTIPSSLPVVIARAFNKRGHDVFAAYLHDSVQNICSSVYNVQKV